MSVEAEEEICAVDPRLAERDRRARVGTEVFHDDEVNTKPLADVDDDLPVLREVAHCAAEEERGSLIGGGHPQPKILYGLLLQSVPQGKPTDRSPTTD